MSKRKKKEKTRIQIIGIVSVVIIILVIIGIILNSTIFSAKTFAKNYAEAVISGDKLKEYKYAGIVDKNEFLNEENLKEENKNQNIKTIDSIKILTEEEAKKNKNVTIPTKEKNQKIFVAQYKLKNNNNTRYLVITIEKTKNKYLIFSNWKAINKDYFSDNIIIKVPNDTIAYINNTKLTEKYKIESNDDITSYEIPSITKKGVVLGLELKNNIIIEKTINPASEKTIDGTDFSGYKLSEKSYEVLKKIVKQYMNSYIKNAINNVDIEKVKNNEIWTEELKKQEEFTTNYQTLVNKYKNKGVKSYTIKNIDVSSSYIYSFDTIKINANITYQYKQNKQEKEKSTTVDLEVANKDKLQIEKFSIYGVQYMF